MGKTKFVKVSVKDRLPNKGGGYTSDLGEIFFNNFRQKFEHNYKGHDLDPEWYFLEVPDREDEMRDMLEENISKAKENISYCIEKNMSNTAHSWEGRLLAYKEMLQLLNELKQ